MPAGAAEDGMGTLNYGSWSIEFEDRLLTHLQIVIVNRLRRGESVLMSWVDSTATGSGRSCIWLTNSVPLYFKFSGSRMPSVDGDWLKRLEASASASTGLIVTDADGALLRVDAHNGAPRHSQPAVRLASRR